MGICFTTWQDFVQWFRSLPQIKWNGAGHLWRSVATRRVGSVRDVLRTVFRGATLFLFHKAANDIIHVTLSRF